MLHFIKVNEVQTLAKDSKRDGLDRYKDAFIGNPDYPVNNVFNELSVKAKKGLYKNEE